MARLPKPGGDAGNWGEVLNEFLREEHNDDGSLKLEGTLATKADTSTVGEIKARLDTEHNADGTHKNPGLTEAEADALYANKSGTAAAITELQANAGAAVPQMGPRPVPIPGTTVAVMDSGEAWSVNATYGSASDTSDWFLGTQHLRIDLTTINRNADKGGLNLNLVDNILWLWVKIDDPTLLASLSVWLWDGANINQIVSSPTYGRSGWVPVQVDIYSVYASAPGAGMDQTAVGKIRIVAKSSSGTTTLRVGGLQISPRTRVAFPNGVVSLTFDDNWLTQYTYAFPALTRYGYRGTIYTIVDGLGTPNHMTLDQLREMHASGWEVGGHAYAYANHDAGMDALAETVVEEEFRAMRKWAIENGFGRCDNYAWPMGKYAGRTSLAGRYYRSARIATSETSGLAQDFRDPVYMQRLHTATVPAAASASTFVDDTYAKRRWQITVIHGIETGPLAAPLASLEALLSALKAKGIPCLPVGDVLDILARPEL